MDPKQQAIAALQQVAQSAGLRDHTGKIAFNATTGSDMISSTTHNSVVSKQAHTDGQTQMMPETDRNWTGKEEGREHSTYATATNQPSSNSNDNSQSTSDSHGIATPPTSSSEGFSSQSTNQDGPLSQLSQLSQLAAAQQPLASTTTRPKLAISPTAGQKRTADGQIKLAQSSPVNNTKTRGHSRNVSTISNVSNTSSKIREISADLKTRLSYAMVKVNHGWESNAIDEVESLASQAGSPTSSNSTLHGRRNLMLSPREALSSVQGQAGGPNMLTQAPTADFDLYSTSGQPTRTYESFWRDHSVVNNPSSKFSSQQSAVSPPPSRGLAPPAEIRPTISSRRSGTPKFSKPPPISGQNSNSSLRTSNPQTPNRGDYREHPTTQTPTQKTLQEQDAIETLLFMSSPGNSGNMSHAFPPRSQISPQESPLRTEFHPQSRQLHGKKVGFDVAATSERSTGSSASSSGAYRRSRIGVVGNTKEREAAVDQLIQDYDSSSDEEEDMSIKFTSPRSTLAAGR